MATNFFHPSLLLLFLDRDPGWVKIRIPDPQHWKKVGPGRSATQIFFLLVF
jgi:hypothetical protein